MRNYAEFETLKRAHTYAVVKKSTYVTTLVIHPEQVFKLSYIALWRALNAVFLLFPVIKPEEALMHSYIVLWCVFNVKSLDKWYFVLIPLSLIFLPQQIPLQSLSGSNSWTNDIPIFKLPLGCLMPNSFTLPAVLCHSLDRRKSWILNFGNAQVPRCKPWTSVNTFLHHPLVCL
jgi:hypothetical protein